MKQSKKCLFIVKKWCSGKEQQSTGLFRGVRKTLVQSCQLVVVREGVSSNIVRFVDNQEVALTRFPFTALFRQGEAIFPKSELLSEFGPPLLH